MERFLGSFVLALFLVCSYNVPASWAQSNLAGSSLNIDCGASTTYVNSVTGLTWVPDTPYITSGKIHSGLDANEGHAEMSTLRYFDDNRPKNCYSLPVIALSTYLLRATFYYNNYDMAGQAPSFQVAVDGTIADNITTSTTDGQYLEYTYVAVGDTTYFCLLRTSPTATPIISGITLKPANALKDGFNKKFNDFLQEGIMMKTRTRVNFGSTDEIRGPTDFYDRYWFPQGTVGGLLTPNTSPVETLNTTSPILALVKAGFGPPSAVLQTAVTSTGNITSLVFPSDWADTDESIYLSVYYAELLNSAIPIPRQFNIQVVGGGIAVANLSGRFLQVANWDFWPSIAGIAAPKMTFTPIATSLRGPIVNALEVFARSGPRALKSDDRDEMAIIGIKASFNLTEWTGDSCVPFSHSWLTCTNPDLPTTSPRISAVNLSGYNLQGFIPPFFANLTGLTSLHLENNRLTGPLPDWLTSLNLKELSVQNNNLSGPIPPALLSSNSLKFTYYPGNPLLTGGSPGATDDGPKPKPNIGAIVGASIGGVLGFILICVFAFLVHRRCKRQPKPSPSDGPGASIMRIGPTGAAKAYTLAEVSAATQNFNRELGKGGFGPVYYGTLPDGQEVAVKVADGSSQQGEKEFFNEVNVLSRVHHKNLVALVGFCQEEKKQILIYEYMHSGSVFDRLHGSSRKAGTIDWKTRLHIALNAAQGLEYLHIGCSPSFIHRDVKSSNILLTPKFDAKVADFGLTKLMGEAEETRVMTLVMGTAGYLDPEYYSTQYTSSKSDVYSFGVVLLELLTGRLPIDRSVAMQKTPNICDWVRESLSNGDIDSILDPAVKASNPNYDALWKVADVAMRSVEPKGIHRPTMTDLVQELQGAVTLEGTAPLTPYSQTPSGYSDFTSSGSQYAPTSYPLAR